MDFYGVSLRTQCLKDNVDDLTYHNSACFLFIICICGIYMCMGIWVHMPMCRCRGQSQVSYPITFYIIPLK